MSADEILNGHNFIALRRLSNRENETLADVGDTCERVLPSPGGTQSDALRALLASGKIAPRENVGEASAEPAPARRKRRGA